MKRPFFPGLLATLLLHAVLCMPASGQGIVTFQGRVMAAKTQTPVGSAFVFPANSRSGTLTDSLGRFVLEVPRAPSYRLRVSQLGYEELELELGADAPDYFQLFVLNPDPLQLEGLTVLAERMEERRRGVYGSVQIMSREELLEAPGTTGFDLVRQMLPFVEPCSRESDSLCMGGIQKHPLKVCIDGHEVNPLMVETSLSGVDPRALYMVEAYTRVGEVRMYTPGYVRRLMEGGVRLPPLNFGCGDGITTGGIGGGGSGGDHSP